MAILKLEDIKKVYGFNGNESEILKGISLAIEEKEFVSIMGPSGSGKSTLLYIMGGLEPQTSGSVFIDGDDISKISDNKKSILRRQKLGFVFQFYNLVQNLTVEENILMPALMDGKKEKDVKNYLEEIIDQVGLSDKRKSMPPMLSGGQQQRVAVARALINKPKLILADEPTGNLDSKNGEEIMGLLKKINAEYNTTIIQVTHSPEFAEYGRIIRIKDGIIA